MLSRTAIVLGAGLLATALLAGCATAPQQSTASSPPGGGHREFWIVSSPMTWEEDSVHMPHDSFMPTTLTVERGDNVTIHFYNTELANETHEHHTFTIGAPYDINLDAAPQQELNATFTASTAGVFDYVCNFHQPTMRGQLVVLG